MQSAALGLTCALLIILNAGAAAADVADYIGKPVASIRAEAEGAPVADPEVLQLIDTTRGRPLSMIAVRETLTHLISLGRFEDVRVVATPSPAGVALLYELVPVHPIRDISFAGSTTVPGVDVGRLRRATTERFGASPAAARAPELVRVIEDELRERGYLHAAVAYRLERLHAPHRAALVFSIEPGVRTAIGRITVTGNPGIPEAQLLSRLRISPGAPYERNALLARLDEFRQSRRSDGYVEARVSVTPEFAAGDAVVHLTVTAEQGPRVRVVFRGDPLPGDKQTELVPIAEEGSADQDLLEDSTNRIQEYLRSAGYPDAVAPHTREEANGELIVTFTISRGPQHRIGGLTVTGSRFIPETEIESQLRARIGQPFSEAQLDSDLSAFRDYYRRQGFADVATRIVKEIAPAPSPSAPIPVSVRVTFTEGVRTLVGTIHVRGSRAIPESTLLEELGLRPGQPFFATQLAIDRDAIQGLYSDRGFQNAIVTYDLAFSADGSRVDLAFVVAEGPQLFVDHVLIVGNVRTSTATIERELQIHEGDALGTSAIVESQRRLAALGLFRRARISQLAHGDETKRDVLITIEEAPVTTIGYGGGLEVGQRVQRAEEQNGAVTERVEFAPRAFFEVGRRNLFDKNRSVNLFTRVTLRPQDSPFYAEQDSTRGDGTGYGFSEYRILGTYREPRVLGTAADAVLTATIEQQVRSSFNFARRAFNAEVGRRLTSSITVSGNYQIQHTRLFNERINPADKLLIDRLFPQVVLSSFSLSGVESTRDDPLDSRDGHYLSANGELAAPKIGSEIGFFKSFLTAQLFRTLPGGRGTVVATSVRLGMASGFPRTIVQTDDAGEPLLDADGQPATEVVKDLPASERFFAGGDTTVRGFALDQLGTSDTLDKDGFALGGSALLILNAELRIPVRGSIGVVGFVDAGNVFSRTTEIDLGELRSAAGFGVRYQSPVGPIRIDLGFKLRRHDLAAGVRERPMALHISLGQAF
jgi:outer membrane protein assembly complex protein YaeT